MSEAAGSTRERSDSAATEASQKSSKRPRKTGSGSASPVPDVDIRSVSSDNKLEDAMTIFFNSQVNNDDARAERAALEKQKADNDAKRAAAEDKRADAELKRVQLEQQQVTLAEKRLVLEAEERKQRLELDKEERRERAEERRLEREAAAQQHQGVLQLMAAMMDKLSK